MEKDGELESRIRKIPFTTSSGRLSDVLEEEDQPMVICISSRQRLEREGGKVGRWRGDRRDTRRSLLGWKSSMEEGRASIIRLSFHMDDTGWWQRQAEEKKKRHLDDQNRRERKRETYFAFSRYFQYWKPNHSDSIRPPSA